MANDQNQKQKNAKDKTVANEKTAGNEVKPADTEDSESLEEQPLDIGEHYLVRRTDETWRK